jgi:hypothetical protein
MQRGMMEWLPNNELKMMCKDVVVTYFKTLFRHLLKHVERMSNDRMPKTILNAKMEGEGKEEAQRKDG